VREPVESIAQVKEDAEIVAIITGQHIGLRSARWTIRQPGRNRIELFNTDELTKMRLDRSDRFPHKEDEVGGVGKSCSLCYIAAYEKRITRTICSCCEIPLCSRQLLGATKTCFDLWHSQNDLVAAQEQQREALRAQRTRSKASGRFEHARNIRRRKIAEHGVHDTLDDLDVNIDDDEGAMAVEAGDNNQAGHIGIGQEIEMEYCSFGWT